MVIAGRLWVDRFMKVISLMEVIEVIELIKVLKVIEVIEVIELIKVIKVIVGSTFWWWRQGLESLVFGPYGPKV